MANIEEKMAKQKIIGQKSFLIGIDSEFFKTYFTTKISKLEIFSRYKIFSGIQSFLDQNREKLQSQEFLVDIDSECFATYLKTKILKSIFPFTTFSRELVIFGQHGQNSEKMTKSKILVDMIF